MRGVVLCLLGLVAVIGFLGSHRGGGGRRAATGGDGADDDGGRLLHRVEVAADADVMEWTEENLTALARRSPEPPVSTCAPPSLCAVDRSLAARRLVLLQRSSGHVNLLRAHSEQKKKLTTRAPIFSLGNNHSCTYSKFEKWPLIDALHAPFVHRK
jgi:hypothetical protein